MDDHKILGYEEYTTEDQDTFDMIAWKVYGDEMMASLLIQKNPDHADVLIFDMGVRLVLPIVESAKMQQAVPPWR